MADYPRHPIERFGLLVIVFGMFITIVVGGLFRVFKVSPDLEVEGWTAYHTYPLAEGCFVAGILIAVVGIGVTLLGKAIR